MFTPNYGLHVMCHVSCVLCQVSGVRCNMSQVTCHVSYVTCPASLIFLFNIFLGVKVEELVNGGSLIQGAYPVQFDLEKRQNTYNCQNMAHRRTRFGSNLYSKLYLVKFMITFKVLQIRLLPGLKPNGSLSGSFVTYILAFTRPDPG